MVRAFDSPLLAPTAPLSDVDRSLIPECTHVRCHHTFERSPGGPPGSTLRLTMKKTFGVLPVVLLTGCASDLSMGQIGVMDGLFALLAAGSLIGAMLLKLGLVKPGWAWDYSVMGDAMMGLGFLAFLAAENVLGLSPTAETVLFSLFPLLFVPGLVVNNRAGKRYRETATRAADTEDA